MNRCNPTFIKKIDYSKQRRIFHLIKGLGRGGAEKLLIETNNFFNNNRFKFRYGYFLPCKNQLVEELKNCNVKVISFGAENNCEMFLCLPKLIRELTDWKADILHCHLPLAGVVGRLAGKIAKVPVIYTEHNLQERYHPLTRKTNLFTWPFQQYVIAVSDEVEHSIKRHIGCGAPIKTVKNGVDVFKYRRNEIEGVNVRREWNIPTQAIVIGTVAVFTKKKGLDDLLLAAKTIIERHPETVVLIVGDGPIKNELIGKCKELDIETSVRFVGIQDDVRSFLSAMDVYIISSHYEGLPVSLLEAMSAELPVVATSVGGIPEVIVNGTSGFLVPPFRPMETANIVVELISNNKIRREIGKNARQRVIEKFSIQKMVSQIESVYTDTIEANSVL